MKTLLLFFSVMVVFTTWSDTKAQPPATDTVCRKLAELYFLIDGSDSMLPEDFGKELNFVKNVVSDLTMNPEDGFSVGVIVFSNELQEIPLGNVADKVSLDKEINKLVHDRDGTYTHRAINRMTDSFAKYGRPDAQKFGILLTDGRSKFPNRTATAAKKAKRSGVAMIAAGIGSSINLDELNTIASIPQFAMTVPDFNALTRLAETVATTVCDPVTSTTVTPTTPRKPGICDNCTFLNGVGYKEHESDCNLFYHCYDNGYELVPALKQCAFGLFWDQGILDCIKPKLQDVARCRCPGGLTRYRYHDNCRAYWECYPDRPPRARCCPGGRYLPVFGCVTDATCQQSCPPRIEIPPNVCNKRPGPTRTTYYVDISATKALRRPCAPGTAFDVATCLCSIRIPVIPGPTCRPVLYLPFDESVNDVSAEKNYVANYGVEIFHGVPGANKGVAYFNGYSNLLIPRFANDDFRDKFLLTFRYKEFCEVVRSTKYEALVTNAGCEEPCSIAVSFDRGSNRTRAKLRTTVGKAEASVRNTLSDWKQVEYKYDGNQLTVTVNGVVERVVSTGLISTVKGALHIGSGCTEFDRFCGYIDELYVYKCLP